ncbi:hypothetical protein HKCCE4037_05290 [Rhodobacterales bacterium HKCCE4037]|nr:hypothetical protein [Rhodobacterales bacterium HKCCE4037]
MSELHSETQPHTRASVTGDVKRRVGPGDAGRQDRPETLPETEQDLARTRGVGSFTISVILVGVVVLVLLWLLI